MTTYCLTVTCRSTRGIVAAISRYLAEQGCNLTDSSQFDDTETGMFFMRVSFMSEEGASLSELKAGFAAVAEPFGIDFAFHDESTKMKTVIMVSASAIA